jgi:hypothetical protein
MTTLDDDGPVQVDGLMVNTSEQLTAWTRENMADLVNNGQAFNNANYKQALQALRDPTKRVVVSIIPCWNHPRMGELIEEFFAQPNDIVRVRTLFADIQLLIGETNIPYVHVVQPPPISGEAISGEE